LDSDITAKKLSVNFGCAHFGGRETTNSYSFPPKFVKLNKASTLAFIDRIKKNNFEYGCEKLIPNQHY
jgi:hypothetical protein